MKLTESYSASCAATSYGVQAWSTSVFDASTTWSNAPAKVGLQDTVNYGPACGSSTSGNLSFLDQVTNAAANHWQTIAFVVVNTSETNDVQYKRFSSAASLSITYNAPPATPTTLTASPTATVGYAASGTPTLSATATDANSDTVRLDYQVLQGTTLQASGSSGFVTSGSAGTWKPTTALPDGAYTWKVRAYDGQDFSPWSTAQSLTIDTHAPSTTAVASTDYPANTWSGTADADGNFTGSFTFTPPSSDVGEVAWQLDGGTWTHTPTTGTPFTKSLTFRAGSHTLVAKTHDEAGNIAADTIYRFNAGSGAALLTPTEGDRPARTLTLTAQGKNGDTGVRYQYRRGTTDTWADVPAADVHLVANPNGTVTWPVAVSNGIPAALTWNISTTLTEDGPVDVRAVFTDGSTTDNSPPNTVVVDRNATNAASQPVGPGALNLATGDFTLAGSDAASFGMAISRFASSTRPMRWSS